VADATTQALRARAAKVVDQHHGGDDTYDAAIAALQRDPDLEPTLREAALRDAHRRRATDDALIARLWRDLTPTELDPLQRWIARGLAADMNRAAGHRNQQDSRRATLWGGLTCRCGDYEPALDRLQRARMLNEQRHPGLFAVDLAFLAMAHAGLADKPKAEGALAELERLLTDQPTLRSPRLDQFHAEARAAVAGLPDAPPPDDR
jgi:hypothetical protein